MSTVLQGLNEGLRACLEESEQVCLLGEDLLDPYGGAFKVTQGLSTDFPGRVIGTPVSEAAIVGAAVGMAIRGLRPVVEIMFGDFLMLAGDQLLNHASKFRWMSNDKVRVPLVVRTPMGGRRGYGPTHSQSLEKHFLGIPGLRTVALNTCTSPRDLLRKAVLEDDDPVLLIEHKLLYALAWGEPGDEFESTSLGGFYPAYLLKIRGAPEASLTLAAYGYMAELAKQAMLKLAYEHEVFTELLVPSQLSPFSDAYWHERISQTRTLLTIEEAGLELGWGAECLARMQEALPGELRMSRVAARQLPVPAAGSLERAVLPQVDGIVSAALGLLA